MPDSYKQNHVVMNPKAARSPKTHPVQVEQGHGFDASQGGVSAGHSKGSKLSSGKTNMSTGASKGGKVSAHSNTPKRDSRSGIYKTTPLSPVAKGAGQGMSSAYTKQHKQGPQPGSKKTF